MAQSLAIDSGVTESNTGLSYRTNHTQSKTTDDKLAIRVAPTTSEASFALVGVAKGVVLFRNFDTTAEVLIRNASAGNILIRLPAAANTSQPTTSQIYAGDDWATVYYQTNVSPTDGESFEIVSWGA